MIRSLPSLAVLAAITLFPCLSPCFSACDYASVETNENQYPVQVQEPDGRGFTADWVQNGMRVVRTQGGKQLWRRNYNSNSLTYHFSAHRTPDGPLRIFSVGSDNSGFEGGVGTTYGLSVVRQLSLDPETGDSLGTDTLYIERNGLLVGTFIALRDGGTLTCLYTLGTVLSGKDSVFQAIRTGADGKVLWRSDLPRYRAGAESSSKLFMVAGGLEREDGSILVAAGESDKIRQGIGFVFLEADAAGHWKQIGSGSEMPCEMRRDSRRIHYTGYGLHAVLLNLLTGFPEKPETLTPRVWIDMGGITNITGRTRKAAESAKAGLSRARSGALKTWNRGAIGFDPGTSGDAMFRADGSEIPAELTPPSVK
jgi:hypothetical protein